MSRFEYLSVLISIVIALGVSEQLASWGRLLRLRRRVRFHWLHAVWSVLVVVFMVQFWWGFWNYRTVAEWSFAGLLAVVAEALVMVLAALVLTPGEVAPDGVDLRAHYYEQKGLFFSLALLLIAQLSLVDHLVAGQPFLHAENALRGLGCLVLAWAARSDSEPVHAGLALAAATLFGCFTLAAIAW